MAEDKHPGISMHKIPVGGGFVGLLFAAGRALIFLLGFPTLWYFVALAFLLGIGIAALMRYVNEGRSETSKPLSIFNTENERTKVVPMREPPSNLLQASPLFS